MTDMKVDAKAVAARYDAALNAMVDKFLCWKFPKDFAPDAGISFKPCGPHDSPHWPIGTNILTAEQAKQMFRDCVPPSCFGLDDCSSQALSVCDFANKCGKDV